MSSIVSTLHIALSKIVAVLWLPLSLVSQSWALAISGIIFGMVMVVAYGYVSNQGAIRRVKNDITSYILETFLFRHDTVLSLKAQGKLFTAGMKYFILALGPILILAVPCILILAHLNLRLGYRPLHTGEEKILTLHVVDSSQLESLKISGEGINVSLPVRTPKDAAAYFKLSSSAEGEYKVQLPGGEVQTISIRNENTKAQPPLGIFLSNRDWLQSLFVPNAGPIQKISSKTLSEIEFTYPEKLYRFFGVEVSWILPFFIVSLLAGYIGSKFLDVAV